MCKPALQSNAGLFYVPVVHTGWLIKDGGVWLVHYVFMPACSAHIACGFLAVASNSDGHL